MCADTELPTDSSVWHFCILYYVEQIQPCSDTSVEFALCSIFCTAVPDVVRGRSIGRAVKGALRSLQTSGYLSRTRMVHLTGSGQNYLDSLVLPNSDHYRTLLDAQVERLMPWFDDTGPGQAIATFYADSK